jgi:DNA primase
MSMVNQALVSTLNSVLGTGKSTSKGNYAYHCPFCHHHKPKLEINLNETENGENKWHCWVCDKRGKSVVKLFQLIDAPKDKILEAKTILKYNSGKLEITEVNKQVELPQEFISLSTPDNSIEYKHAISYLKRRQITINDILKYNIGYCSNGKYTNCIIIPSYDKDGKLNYFTARNFDKNSTLKYKNPDVSRDIIPFELFINWNLPIILCEGPFDALAIKRNVVPLLGKNIQKSLRKKLVKSEVQKIYIALDKDAIKQALSFCEELINEGKEVYLVEMEDKDPSDMGFENFTKLIQTTQPLTFSDLFEKKLQL